MAQENNGAPRPTDGMAKAAVELAEVIRRGEQFGQELERVLDEKEQLINAQAAELRWRRARDLDPEDRRGRWAGWAYAAAGLLSLAVYAGLHWLHRPVVYHSDLAILVHGVVSGLLVGLAYDRRA